MWGVYIGGKGIGIVGASTKRAALKIARKEHKLSGIWVEELDA